MAVKRSVVKWFDAKKGYGFIVHPGGGSDIFVHYSQVVSDKQFKTLRTGEVVEFELCDGPKGVHANNVKPINTLEQNDGLGMDLPEISDGRHITVESDEPSFSDSDNVIEPPLPGAM